MGKYYRSNALYEYLSDNNIDNFEYCVGDLWQLVYGDSNCSPKLIVVVSGVEHSNITEDFRENEIMAIKRSVQISKLTNVPIVFIRFSVDKDVDKVYFYNKDHGFYSKTVNELTQFFEKYGLPVSTSSTNKYLNDKTSSAYHNWQRDSLGSQIKVSDIDLVRIDKESDNILDMYELKRSFISLAKWQPYTDDYNNFRLLGNLLINTNIPLGIVYNVRTKNPWNDDVSNLKLFEVNVQKARLINYTKTITIEEFVK